MDQNQKKIEIVSGNGKDLNISDVSTHISSLKPKTKSKSEKKQKIVVPKAKFNVDENDNSETNN